MLKKNNQNCLPKELEAILINLYNEGKFEEILKKENELFLVVNKSINLLNIIGLANLALKNFNKAIQNFNKAITINPHNPEVFYNLGITFHHKGKMDEAIENYKNAISLKPDYADAYCNQGMSFKEKGDFDAALKCYKSAIKINPNHLGSFYNLGDIFNLQGRLIIALKYYKTVIKIEPNYAEGYYSIGEVFTKMGNINNALNYYRKAIKLRPNFFEAYNNIGNLYEIKGDLDLAIDNYLRCLKIQPKNSVCLSNANSLMTQINCINESKNIFEDYFNDANEILKFHPIFQMQKGIQSFLNGDIPKTKKYLLNISSCRQSSFKKLDDQQLLFYKSYRLLLSKLCNENSFNQTKKEPIIYHIGESHSLSFTNKNISIKKDSYKIKSLITFGAKAFHLSKEGKNKYKSITSYNFKSLPKGSRVFLSFGEIDCRPNEGFIIAAEKKKIPLKELIKKTVKGYVSWFSVLNLRINHVIYFLNLPSPVYDSNYSKSTNRNVLKAIKYFNFYLAEQVEKHNFNIINTFKYSSNKNGFSNKIYHIDNYHLGPSIIPKIENQLS